MTLVSLCDAVGLWTGSPTPALNDPSVFGQREGSYCLQSYSNSAAARSADWTYTTDQVLTDMVIYMWFATSSKAALPAKGANGIRIRIEDAAANWAEWDIFGGDTLPHGGWICWAVLASSATASRTGGTFPTLTTIRKIGWRCSSIAGKVYIYFDAVRFAQGLQIYGGTSGDPAVFENFVTAEDTNAYGVVNKYKGIYFVQGKIYIGSASLGQATYFKDISKSLRFQDNLITSAFYELKTLANANADTEVYLGSGGISGCDFGLELSTQIARYVPDFSPATRTKIGLHGSSFRRAGIVYLPPYDASYLREVLNCNFELNSGLTPLTCPITTSKFISYVAMILSTGTITGCSFISGTGLLTMGGGIFTTCVVSGCTVAVAMFWNVAVDTNGKLDGTAFTSSGTGHAIELGPNCPAAITFKNMAFNDYGANDTTDAAIYNNSNKAIAISLIGTTQPTVRNGSGASTSFPSSITLKIAVKDITGNPMVGVRCYIDDNNVTPFILDNITDSNGERSVVHTAGPVSNATWRVRKYGYLPFQQIVNIGSVDITLPVTLIDDPNY